MNCSRIQQQNCKLNLTKFITNIPTIGQFDPSRSQRPNKDFHSNHRTGKPKLPV